MPSYREAKARSERKLQKAFKVGEVPKVYEVNCPYYGQKKFSRPGKRKIKICSFHRPDQGIELFEYTELRNTPIKELHQSYCQLDNDRIKDGKNNSFMIEVRVEFPRELTIVAGYEWAFLGRLKTKDKFLAVLNLKVRRIFRGCGLSTLIKFKELDLARKQTCDFIQTYHAADNPYFLSAISPSLNQGFVLYHGRPTGIEAYEEEGYIHLRKYLKRKTRPDIKVTFKDGTVFKSNKENHLILEHLKNAKGLPGRHILKIEEYGE